MSFVDVDKLKVTERLPGWRGRYFHAVNMTVAHYEFTRGASIYEHHHPQEELYEVLEGELMMRRAGIAWLSSTHKSIEEIATTILRDIRPDRLVY